MSRMNGPREVLVLVEGPTEEAMIKRVLAPAAFNEGLILIPSPVITSKTAQGTHRGGGAWKHYDERLKDMFKATHFTKIALLIDYDKYPSNAPGASGDPDECERALVEDYPDHRFRPHVVMHEIEALVLAAIAAGYGDERFDKVRLRHLRQVIERAGGPEKVNNGEATAPSKRLKILDPAYGKIAVGPELVAEAGLGAVLEQCPRFATWWEELLS